MTSRISIRASATTPPPDQAGSSPKPTPAQVALHRRRQLENRLSRLADTLPPVPVRRASETAHSPTYPNSASSNTDRAKILGYTNPFRPTPARDRESYPGLRLLPKPAPEDTPAGTEELPGYSCQVHYEGVLYMKRERASPFSRDPSEKPWERFYAIIHGTALHLFHMNTPRAQPSSYSSAPPPNPHPTLRASSLSEKQAEVGPIYASFSLQHAEVGCALDFVPVQPKLKSKWARLSQLMSLSEKPKDPWVHRRLNPDLYEPSLSYAFRLRAHQWQILFAMPSEGDMLNWIDNISMAIDVSLPIEGRAEPRQRTVPRREARMNLLRGGLVHPSPTITNITHTIQAAEQLLQADSPTDQSDLRRELAELRQLYNIVMDEYTPVSPTDNSLAAFFPKAPLRSQKQTPAQERRFRKRVVPILFQNALLTSRSMLDNEGKRVYVMEKRYTLIPWEQYWSTKQEQLLEQQREKERLELLKPELPPLYDQAVAWTSDDDGASTSTTGSCGDAIADDGDSRSDVADSGCSTGFPSQVSLPGRSGELPSLAFGNRSQNSIKSIADSATAGPPGAPVY